MNKKQLRKKLALMLANLKKKRKYYCELEYIQSTGTQYIDTGYNPNSNTKVEAKFKMNETSNTFKWLFSSRNQALAGDGYGFGSVANGFIDSEYNNRVSSTTDKLTNGTVYTIVKDKNVCRYNDSVLTNAVSTFTVNYPLPIFALNNIGTIEVSSYAKANCYYFKIYDNDVLVRDFIPVLDWNMTPCMYDKVSGQLFYNQATSGDDFSYGRQVHYVDYLESTGTQYIDTGVYGNLNTKIEAKVYSAQIGLESGYGIAGDLTTSTKAITMPFNFTSTGLYSRFGNKAIITGIQQQKGTYTFAVDKVGYYVDGAKIANLNTTTSFTTDGTITLFGFKGLGRNYLVGKMYYCKIWDGDTLVRDFIPAIDENGVGFMFDQVTHTIYDNAGTGQFSYPAREVEYLESTGTQYIDTGVYPAQLTKAEIDIQFTSLGKCSVLGSNNGSFGSNGWNNLLGINTNNNYFWSQWGVVYTGNFTKDTNRHLHTFERDGDISWTYTVDNTSLTNTTGILTQPTNNQRVLYLFACNNNGTLYRQSYAKIYNCKIYDNNTLVRDFIPSYKDGALGMWDKVNNVFYQNAGTGDGFITGKIVEPEYE